MDTSELPLATPTDVNHTFALYGKLDYDKSDSPGEVFYACVTAVERKICKFRYFDRFQSEKWRGHDLYTLSAEKIYSFEGPNRAAFLGPAFVQSVTVVSVIILYIL